MLSKEQKLDIVRSRINIIEGVLYNLDLAIIEEQAKSQPSTEYINEFNTQKNDNLLALEAMNDQLDLVLAE